MVITAKEEICKIKHQHLLPLQPEGSVIYELQDIELIPFSSMHTPQKEA